MAADPAKLAKGAAALRYLLQTHGIKDVNQATLFDAGIDTVAKYAAFAATEDDLTQVLKAHFSLDAAANLSNRAQVACFVVAWQTARVRIKHHAEVEAASETREWAKPIQPSEYVAIRKAFVAKHGEIEEKVTPAKEYLEKKLHELEGGEFRAETLGEVVSRDEVDPDTMLPVWDSKGSLTVKKASSTVSMPTGPEQLRHRLTIMQNALLMMILKHPDRPELRGIDKDLFDRYKDYILGEYVYGLRSSEESGSHAPPWTLVLSYEQAVRKWACKQMAQRSISFADSLRESWKEPAVKERHFTTPLALYAKRPPPPPPNPWKGGKGNGKDGKKGGGKTPGKTGKPKGANRTPDGKPICFRFQSKGGCRKGAKCHFAHVCCHCFGNHAGHACKTVSAGGKNIDAQADTQGAA